MKNFSESSCVGSINLDKPATDEEIILRWSRLGLIPKSFDDELKLGLARTYEDMARVLIFRQCGDENSDVIVANINEWFEQTIFPIINRVVRYYYYRHNETKILKPEDLINFFMNTSIGDIIEKEYPIYDTDDTLGKQISEDELNERTEHRRLTKMYFNRLFETILDKNTKLINFEYNTIYDNMKNISELDIEAIFVCMICDYIYYKLFEENL